MSKVISARQRRHDRLRKKVRGASGRPRLSVRRSLQNIFVQVVDDVNGVTLANGSTTEEVIRRKFPYGGNVKAAALLGEVMAARAKEKGISKVVFDRGGYDYHGRIKAFAEAARQGGMEF